MEHLHVIDVKTQDTVEVTQSILDGLCSYEIVIHNYFRTDI